MTDKERCEMQWAASDIGSACHVARWRPYGYGYDTLKASNGRPIEAPPDKETQARVRDRLKRGRHMLKGGIVLR